MGSEFRQFLLRGNVVELAVGIVIGVAFGAVITSFVANLLTPLIAAIFGEPDFSAMTFQVNNAVFRYGAFLNSLIAFVAIAAAVFFFVVKPANALSTRAARNAVPDDSIKNCPECLSTIPLGARRCAHCAELVAS
ncbi:MAG: large conductance mechanosensitive channel protein MscL [Dehalococcoidia bacterium]|nr:MAG: large conductance mechanosensitive channel protein MscL [Dehalococcoidia bacterium]